MQPFTYSMLSFLAIFSLCFQFNFTNIFATSRFQLESKLHTNETDTDFIKASCETTRYPDLCYKTLSPYASTIETNAMELANAALTVCLKSAKSTSKAVQELLKGRDVSMRDGQAVADCLENMSDYVDEIKKSMVEMKDLDGPDFKEKLGNLKTWVSAALTDEDTCMDGFQEDSNVVKNVKIKETIRGYIVNLAELTSNALALITNIS
ncbi:pectinesterase inhibitor 7-like [Rutidosis leptorrhynchoides]|uniref:pectinesterase inhibitor 7-like n=1 Tax=Rutidosis leptorrhynchoides TaxID=125765 RepID=UPI003A99771C